MRPEQAAQLWETQYLNTSSIQKSNQTIMNYEMQHIQDNGFCLVFFFLGLSFLLLDNFGRKKKLLTTFQNSVHAQFWKKAVFYLVFFFLAHFYFYASYFILTSFIYLTSLIF